MAVGDGSLISIHAPQWGATGSFLFFDWLDVISIHAPQWGATAPWMVRVSSRVFQSTHPSGVRRGPADITPTALPIFQSTHPSGVRHSVNSAIIQYLIFQSTHPSGVRRSRSGTRGCLRDFNPRTPVGCDPRLLIFPLPASYFNPRTPVGCDLPPLSPPTSQHISIHAPQWGATSFPPRFFIKSKYFNPRTPVGCDAASICTSVMMPSFQSTHPSGVRRPDRCPSDGRR